MRAIPSIMLLAVLISGCAETVGIPREECVDRCIDVRLSYLAKIDHETPSVEALREIEAQCRRHWECRPCKWRTGFVHDTEGGDIPLCTSEEVKEDGCDG